MNPQIQAIYDGRKVIGKSGAEIALHSEIDPAEGAFIHRIISEDTSITRTLEIGCACGLSSLHICDALASRPGARHLIIDPFQTSVYDSVGLLNLEQAGIGFFDLIEKRSEFALPELLSQGESTFDFIFIDGWHTFDHTLLDAFYATRLLRTGGYLVIDDVGIAPVCRAADYLSLYPCYQVHAKLSVPRGITLKRRLAKAALGLIPASVRSRSLHPAFERRVLGTESVGMLALKKTAEDTRPWNWFPEGF